MSPPASLSGQPVNQNGLVVQVGNGYERMVMTDQEICDDVLATIPKLKAAVDKDTFGRRWKQRKRKNGVEMFELAPGGGDDPDDDLDIAHAMVAKAEIRCHLNEVLNVLINHDSSDYQASMQALCGNKFQRGQVLFKQRRKLTQRQTATSAATPTGEANVPQEGLIGVQLATLRPKLRVKIQSKHKRTQRLVFASCTQQYPTKDRAIHVMKTIPKDAHDQVVASDDRTSLRRELNHIAVGYDMQSKYSGWGAVNHSTRIFLHAYASTVPPSQYGSTSTKIASPVLSATELARRREAVMNPEAEQVMDILTKSLRNIEVVIRRRRLGFQTFVYFPTTYNDLMLHSSCSICYKHFSFFRRDHFCQLCGHMVCNDCSQNYEVEARIGEVRKNRCCIQCVVRVDNCVYDDDELLPALGPLVVDVDDETWLDESASDDDDTMSVVSDSSSISDNLFSADPMQRSQALGRLAQLVGPASAKVAPPPKTVRATSGGRPPVKPKTEVVQDPKKQILRDVEKHVNQSLRRAKDRYRNPEELPVYGAERDYNFTYDTTGAKTASPNVPLAPVPEPKKEAKRLQHIKESGVLDEKYDRSALELLAQVAAKKLGCPIGFVSVVDDSQFRAIASYNLPEIAFALPRDENLCMHSVYAEKPMIVKNPTRDMRFAQMGCIKDLGVKFYAGFPVFAPDGTVVASLCTADSETHHNISTKDYATMEALSKLAAELIVPKSPTSASGSGVRAPAKAMAHGHRNEPYVVY